MKFNYTANYAGNIFTKSIPITFVIVKSIYLWFSLDGSVKIN